MAKRHVGLESSTYYALLGVEQDDDTDTIRRAYNRSSFAIREGARTANDFELRCLDILQYEVREAFAVLSSSELRRAYDHVIAMGHTRFRRPPIDCFAEGTGKHRLPRLGKDDDAPAK